MTLYRQKGASEKPQLRDEVGGKQADRLSDAMEEMYPICKDCHHSMSMHVGVVDMGGGHSEPIGCTHNVDGGICDCLKYEEGWDE